MTLNKKVTHHDPTFPCPLLVRQRGDRYPREFLDLQERRDVHGGLQERLVGGDDFGALDVALELLHVPLELGAPVLEPRDHLREEREGSSKTRRLGYIHISLLLLSLSLLSLSVRLLLLILQ